MSTDTYHDDSRPPPERPKTVLFCPECGHQSPIAGDWEAVAAGDERLLVCTDCGSVIDRRSRRRCSPQGAVSVEAPTPRSE